MQSKKDPDATAGMKLLRLFRRLLVDGRPHYLADLAEELSCSPQTVIRMMRDIETVLGSHLERGLDGRRRWYRLLPEHPNRFSLDCEELRYLSICRDLAAPTLPAKIRERVDETIFNLSLLLAEQNWAASDDPTARQFGFYSKGRIDYSPFSQMLETLFQAVQTHTVCAVRYKAPGKEEVEHRFAPARLVSMNQAIYANGALLEEDLQTVRHYAHLAVHRLRACSLLSAHFSGPFPPWTGNCFGLPWHEPREFRIRFARGRAADYVRERIWADQQTMAEDEEGNLILTIVTRSEPELRAWVRSFGEAAVLLTSPQEPAAQAAPKEKP